MILFEMLLRVWLLWSLALFLITLCCCLAVYLRLQLPMLYYVGSHTLFRAWDCAHADLSRWILWALLTLTALSWLVTLFRWIQDAADDWAADRAVVEELARRVRQARNNGGIVNTDGL